MSYNLDDNQIICPECGFRNDVKDTNTNCELCGCILIEGEKREEDKEVSITSQEENKIIDFKEDFAKGLPKWSIEPPNDFIIRSK